MSTRRLTALLAAAALGLSLAVVPAASASAAAGVIVHNTCGHRATVQIYLGSHQVASSSIPAGGSQSFQLTVGNTYGITTSPTMWTVTVRDRILQGVKLCRG